MTFAESSYDSGGWGEEEARTSIAIPRGALGAPRLPDIAVPAPKPVPAALAATIEQEDVEELVERTGLSRVRLVADEARRESFASTGSERREGSRRACVIELEFTEDTEFFTGLSQDIAEGGIFVATYALLPIGTMLALSFELPSGALVEARGQVRWVRNASENGTRPGLGIAFTELSAGASEQIAAFCATRPPLFFDV